MQLYQGEKPFTLSINNLQPSTSVIDLLKPVLKNKPIECFALQNNSFVNVREGIEFAVEVMESNETIQRFYWTSNTINSMEDARHLVDSIISHPSIDQIRLENWHWWVYRSSLLVTKTFQASTLIETICTLGTTLQYQIILQQTLH